MKIYVHLFKIPEEDALSILLLNHLMFEAEILGWIENTRINFGV